MDFEPDLRTFERSYTGTPYGYGRVPAQRTIRPPGEPLNAVSRPQLIRDTDRDPGGHGSRPQARRYRQRHSRIETTLIAMGVPKEALETRHAVFDDQVESDGKRFTLRATLVKYDQPVCQCSAGFDDSTPEFQWSAGVTP